jgi:energy-coupling factor transporter ATP-binding protein EcfA2
MSILELHDVHRVHGSGATAVHALRGVSLAVEEGELVAVMGPSGSGKSTMLNLAGGLDRPTRGEVVVEGTALGACSRKALAALRRRRVAAGGADGRHDRRRPADPVPAADRASAVAAISGEAATRFSEIAREARPARRAG